MGLVLAKFPENTGAFGSLLKSDTVPSKEPVGQRKADGPLVGIGLEQALSVTVASVPPTARSSCVTPPHTSNIRVSSCPLPRLGLRFSDTSPVTELYDAPLISTVAMASPLAVATSKLPNVKVPHVTVRPPGLPKLTAPVADGHEIKDAFAAVNENRVNAETTRNCFFTFPPK